MRINVAGRQTGKSTLALRWMAEDPHNRVIISFSESAVDSLYHYAMRTYPDTPWQRQNFLGPNAAQWPRISRVKSAYIDDADLLLHRLFPGMNIVEASWTADDTPLDS